MAAKSVPKSRIWNLSRNNRLSVTPGSSPIRGSPLSNFINLRLYCVLPCVEPRIVTNTQNHSNPPPQIPPNGCAPSTFRHLRSLPLELQYYNKSTIPVSATLNNEQRRFAKDKAPSDLRIRQKLNFARPNPCPRSSISKIFPQMRLVNGDWSARNHLAGSR